MTDSSGASPMRHIQAIPALEDLRLHIPVHRLSSTASSPEKLLSPHIMRALDRAAAQVRNAGAMSRDWGGDSLKFGPLKALFHGPSGSGKTLAACVLGQRIGRRVYRIGLSQVASKFMGETESAMKSLFQNAAQEDWVLFFDEADAIFAPRDGTVTGGHDPKADRYSREAAFVMSQLEVAPNMVILGINRLHVIDDAHARRFELCLNFEPAA